MSDIVGALRSYAEQAGLNRDLDPSYYEGRKRAFMEAANLLESDPDYRALPAMKALLVQFARTAGIDSGTVEMSPDEYEQIVVALPPGTVDKRMYR